MPFDSVQFAQNVTYPMVENEILFAFNQLYFFRRITSTWVYEIADEYAYVTNTAFHNMSARRALIPSAHNYVFYQPNLETESHSLYFSRPPTADTQIH